MLHLCHLPRGLGDQSPVVMPPDLDVSITPPTASQTSMHPKQQRKGKAQAQPPTYDVLQNLLKGSNKTMQQLAQDAEKDRQAAKQVIADTQWSCVTINKHFVTDTALMKYKCL